MAYHLPEGLSPDSIDTLTELVSIVVKLRPSPSSSNLAGLTQSGVTPAAGPSGATPVPGAGGTGSTPLASGQLPNAAASFTIKDLPAATDHLKHKLQRARAAIKTLPDIGRTIARQEADIAELEERKRQQIAMLNKIKDEGLQFAHAQSRKDEDEQMDD
jgi:hypothetical protein